MIKYNFSRTDLSKTQIGNTLGRNVLASLPRNSVIFLSGDTTTFNTWYIYYVLKERQDINIINPPGIGNNIFLDKELNDYFNKNPKIKLSEIVSRVFDELQKKREMYTTYLIDPMPKERILIPKGLVHEIETEHNLPQTKEQYLSEIDSVWKKIKVSRRETLKESEQNFIAPEIPTLYSRALVYIGDFIYYHYKDPATAESFYRRALWLDGENSLGYSGLAYSQYAANHDCKNSIKNMKKAISLSPIWNRYYERLFVLYKNCRVDSKMVNDFKKEYQSKFGQDIHKNLPKEYQDN